MYSISNNNFICLTRGDTFISPLFINQGNRMRPIRFSLKTHPNAEVYLGILEPNQPFEKALIRKKYNSESNINKYGDLVIELRPEDTEYLLPGKYFYQIKLRLANGRIDTIVPKTEFIIME